MPQPVPARGGSEADRMRDMQTAGENTAGHRSAGGDRRVLGAALAVLGGACWGASGSMGQYLFQYQGMDSRWLVPYRLFLAGIVMFIYNLLRHRDRMFRVFETPRSIFWTLYYAYGICVCQFLYFQTIQWSSAGTGTILQDLSPVFVLMWTCIRMRRGPKPREIAAIILALAGVFLITTHGQIQTVHVSLRALLAGVCSAVCVFLYNEVPGHVLERYTVGIFQTWGFLIGGGTFFLIFHPWTSAYVPNAAGIGGLAFVVVVGNIVAFTSYMTGVAMIGPGKAILYGFSEPVTAAIITIVLLKSPFTIYDAAGFAAVFIMLFLVSLQEKDKEGEETS